MDLQLTRMNALVCGSSKGIGKASAHELAILGANVTLVARSEELLKQIVEQLPNNGQQKHSYLVLDLSKPETIAPAIELHIAALGNFHILINNTGGPAGGPAIEADPEAYLNAFKLHLIANQTLAQAVVPGMKAAGYGRIINVISTSVKQPIPGLGVSNTIRGAVGNWAKTLSLELGPHNITVNNVLPGFTETERLEEIINNKASKTGKSPEDVAEDMQNTVPLRRFAQPSETAAAVAFLASPAASYINGINLPVDGGRTGSL